MTRHVRPGEPSETCPWCHKPIPEGAKACPDCGSDDETGWKSPEDMITDGVELPETDLSNEDYAEFLEKEFGVKRKPGLDKRTLTTLVVVGTLVAFLLYVLSR